ncbi:hypothetical protein GGF39_002602 [Coemansia sp. RSA 1721]|nr:hypothetical protein GGF39_002602 [Coemansia sp. RSA 1721]
MATSRNGQFTLNNVPYVEGWTVGQLRSFLERQFPDEYFTYMAVRVSLNDSKTLKSYGIKQGVTVFYGTDQEDDLDDFMMGAARSSNDPVFY